MSLWMLDELDMGLINFFNFRDGSAFNGFNVVSASDIISGSLEWDVLMDEIEGERNSALGLFLDYYLR